MFYVVVIIVHNVVKVSYVKSCFLCYLAFPKTSGLNFQSRIHDKECKKVFTVAYPKPTINLLLRACDRPWQILYLLKMFNYIIFSFFKKIYIFPIFQVKNNNDCYYILYMTIIYFLFFLRAMHMSVCWYIFNGSKNQVQAQTQSQHFSVLFYFFKKIIFIIPC